MQWLWHKLVGSYYRNSLHEHATLQVFLFSCQYKQIITQTFHFNCLCCVYTTFLIRNLCSWPSLPVFSHCSSISNKPPIPSQYINQRGFINNPHCPVHNTSCPLLVSWGVCLPPWFAPTNFPPSTIYPLFTDAISFGSSRIIPAFPSPLSLPSCINQTQNSHPYNCFPQKTDLRWASLFLRVWWP